MSNLVYRGDGVKFVYFKGILEIIWTGSFFPGGGGSICLFLWKPIQLMIFHGVRTLCSTQLLWIILFCGFSMAVTSIARGGGLFAYFYGNL